MYTRLMIKRVKAIKPYLLFLIFVVSASFLFRSLFLQDNLFFGFEQGRDMIRVRDVLHGDITLLGPKTDIDGVFHGPLSYYILAPIYVVTGGSPLFMLLFLIGLHSLAAVILYKVAQRELPKPAHIIAPLLFAVSYPMIVYARWLSNPNLVVPLTIAIIYCLSMAKEKKVYLPFATILFGILCHLQIAVAILIAPPLLFFFLRNKLYTNRKMLFIAIAALVAVMSTYVVFELKNNFLMTRSYMAYSQTASHPVDRTKTFDGFFDHVQDFFFVDKKWISFVTLGAFALYAAAVFRKNSFVTFLLIGIFAPPLFFYALGMAPLRHFYNASPVFLVLLLSAVFADMYKVKKILGVLAVLLFLFFNIKTYAARIPENVANFLYHAQRMYLGDQKRVIDYAYNHAHGQPFSYDYYSIPYWKAEAWEYLFDWYATNAYGYRPQQKNTDVFYVFMEPDESQPLYKKTWYENLNKESDIIDSYTSRHLTVEVRQRKSP